jgi:hypothetical protein
MESIDVGVSNWLSSVVGSKSCDIQCLPLASSHHCHGHIHRKDSHHAERAGGFHSKWSFFLRRSAFSVSGCYFRENQDRSNVMPVKGPGHPTNTKARKDVLDQTDVAKLRLNVGRYMADQATYILGRVM